MISLGMGSDLASSVSALGVMNIALSCTGNTQFTVMNGAST